MNLNTSHVMVKLIGLNALLAIVHLNTSHVMVKSKTAKTTY